MDQANVDPAQVQRMMAVMMPVFAVLALLVYALIIVPLWVAFKKAGLSPWLSLLVLIPGIGLLVALYVLAFARWRVVTMPPEYPAYPAPGYGGQAYPPQVYTQPGAYPQAGEPTYPPVEPPREG